MVKVIKRNGKEVGYDGQRVVNAILGAMRDVSDINEDMAYRIENEIRETLSNGVGEATVDEISDAVEESLMRNGATKVAKKYILYRADRDKSRGKMWDMSDLQYDIWSQKYEWDNEGWEDWLERVSGSNQDIKKLIRQKKFLFGGRILASRGLDKTGRKITMSNCYVITPPEDNIESIFEVGAKLARTFSYGGGCGIHIGNLRPNGSKVNNAALTTSGATSFMELYSTVTSIIGQKGRRGALMISIPVDHPDIEEFINIKNDLEKVTKANISVMITDEFMNAVRDDSDFELKFEVYSNGEVISKIIRARDLFTKLSQSNWDVAEPGALFWDHIKNYNLLSNDEEFEFAGVNPLAI